MNYAKLEKNIIDVIKEQQAKLGYIKEKVRLYYPLNSLNHFFGTEEGAEGMRKVLEGFRDCIRDRLGDVEVSEKDGRFCFLIPEEGAEYVHSLTGEMILSRSLSMWSGNMAARSGRSLNCSGHIQTECILKRRTMESLII